MLFFRMLALRMVLFIPGIEFYFFSDLENTRNRMSGKGFGYGGFSFSSGRGEPSHAGFSFPGMVTAGNDPLYARFD